MLSIAFRMGMELKQLRVLQAVGETGSFSAAADRAAAAFEQIAAGELEVEAIANLSAGSLRVGTFSSAGAAIVVDALRAFRTSHPDVDVSITEIGMPPVLTRSLRRGDL